MASAHLTAALEAARAASDLIRKAYRGNFDVQYKADASPVTEVDVAAERAIKAVLQKHFPDYGFYGEETGRDHADAEYLWLVDPIDGTKSFVRGYPIFSVQIALMHKGELIAGVSCAPCWNEGLGELVWAEKGAGAWRGLLDTPMDQFERWQVSSVDQLNKATLSTGNLTTLARAPQWAALGTLIPQLHRIRGYGDFVHYHLLASGKIDAVVESDVNILDIAALTVIVREAGGTLTDLNGGPVTLDIRTVRASNGKLHAAFDSLAL
ncbi:inositol monophosphatase family protein [Sinimarinibacterium sp. NLF-5-8]|uniref:inositol monophosphatase family protein n=1 Tax=Sinimarinibacterium sp. NLF-5-8 TaxID=2698684 RepID=UPI00137BFEAF|nr:inositol monophosphatase family protein [Sinimarinibacterium sp. NLF-5-8]QHS11030.1 inositol-phosphate phosphatase [Sinimarinibacterium sp. NLF-5-8]